MLCSCCDVTESVHLSVCTSFTEHVNQKHKLRKKSFDIHALFINLQEVKLSLG